MYLQKLSIQGFKSFAHKSKLEFNRGVACIVGPNGSGKSNIADAVRWVLGEQSLKLLRGKKAQDVIFAGSKTKTRLGFAQVDLFLNNEDRSAPIDYSEVMISRRLYRDGESEYLINKNRVRLQDILMLLAKANFGQRSYSVIGQGAVDKILSATPYERKDFFDEATGVKHYQIKKDEAIRKLEHTKENLHQADLLMQEIEPRLRSLTRQVRRLERREVIEDELKNLQREYYGHLWQEILNEHKKLEEKSQTEEGSKKKTEKEAEAIQAEIEKMAKAQSRNEIFQELQKHYNDFLEKKNFLLQQQASYKGKLEIERQKVGGYDLVWLERRCEELSNDKKKINDELKELAIAIDDKDKQLQDKQRGQDKVINEFKRLEDDLIQAKEKLSNKTLPIPEIREEIESLYELQEKIVHELGQIEELKDLEKVKNNADQLKTRLEDLKGRLKKTSFQADPEDVLRIQDNLTLFIKKKDNLVNEIYYLRISLQLKQEKEKMLQKNLTKINDDQGKIEQELNQIKAKPTDQKEALEMAEKHSQDISGQVAELDGKLKELQDKISNFNKEEQQKKDELFLWQRKFQEKQAELNIATRHLNEIKVNLARAETKKEDLEIEMKDELSDSLIEEITKLTQEEHLSEDWSRAEIADKIHKLKNQIELIGGIEPETVKEYEDTKSRHDHLKTQSGDLNKAIGSLEKIIEELEETIKKQFDNAFKLINDQFGKYFKVLFKGGQAKLSLQRAVVREEGEEDEETEEMEDEESSPAKGPTKKTKVIAGVEIFATPPSKKLKNINMLSGGERALTSIALLCAIISNNPSPFVVLDEVDAALDEANSERYAAIIDELSKKTQFILVTHNRATMHVGKILYGVTMGEDGISRLLSVKMDEAEKVIGNEK
ncbi:MAG: AAA family ATPase [Patescibacteria group bacterium]